jgi:hypothetical protein
VPDNALMQLTDLTDTERAVAATFATGSEVDVTGWPDPKVRAEALRFMLLGGVTAEPGDRVELQLTGARVEGAWELEFADIDAPVTLHRPDRAGEAGLGLTSRTLIASWAAATEGPANEQPSAGQLSGSL